jgi:hypothetical protein
MVLVNKKELTPPIHHRKRQGNHHKRNKSYDKSYWPFLPLLAIAGVAMLINLVWSNIGHSHSMVLGDSNGLTSLQLLQETNKDRQSHDINDLRLNSQLSAAAQAKAQSMVSQNYWSHVSPDGKQPWAYVQQQGYQYQAVGENLAYGFANPDDVIAGWLNSPEHRANLLDPAYTNVGFGVVQAANYLGKGPETVVVAMYGRPAEISQLTPQNSSNLPIRQVSRIELVTTSAVPGILYMVIAAAAGAAAVIILRHTRSLHRVLAYSEAYIVKHRTLDIIAITVIAIGALLTRTAGFIH